MRVSISHNKGRQEAKKIVEQQADQLFGSMASGPVVIVDAQKSWTDSVMNFSFKGRMGFFTVPIKGTVEVTDTEVIVDADLPGFLTKMVSEEKIRAGIQTRVRGLLT
jgi:hypothetical protein